MFKFGFILLSYLCFQGYPARAQSQTITLSSEENNFYQLINQFRQKLNLPFLELQALLEFSAQKHSAWMDSQNFLTHYGPINNLSPFQRMNLEGYVNYTWAGENIACGNGDAINTFRQWAFSPPHLENMVNPHFHQMGIARAGTGNEHCPYYWTNDLGSMMDPNLDNAPVIDQAMINQAIVDLTGPLPSATPNPNSEIIE